jgi:hypothetical protein
MRRIVAIVAMVCIAAGLVWQYGGWLLEWMGRALGVQGLTTSYDAFVDGFMAELMAKGSFTRIVGPWLFIGATLVALAFLHLPDPKRLRLK